MGIGGHCINLGEGPLVKKGGAANSDVQNRFPCTSKRIDVTRLGLSSYGLPKGWKAL